MQITIFGATGNIGQRVVALALAQGHSVVAFTHRTKLTANEQNLTVLSGDIHDPADVQRAIAGSEVVISCLGSWHTKTKDIQTAAMQAIIPAMQTQGIRRIISVTGAGAFDEGDLLPIDQKLSHFMISMLAGKILRDGEQHIALLRASNLDWTVVRSPVMNNRGDSTYKLSMKLPSLLATINRQAVTECMVAQIVSKDFIAQSPVISRA